MKRLDRSETMKSFLSCILIVATFFAACNKETFITTKDARVLISADTIRFDTVFTGTGSITQSFTIHNENNQKLLISDITLKGGSHSPFKINVDGFQGPVVSNVEIEANDSIYVF